MFKLNRERTYDYLVNITVYEDKRELRGQFTATFRAVPGILNEGLRDADVLRRVLLSVKDIEVPGDNGQLLQGDDLVQALIDDPATQTALVHAYIESAQKKNRGRT